jgi:hypothetical protein
MAAIAVVVDGGSGGIEPTAPMTVLLMVAAVDGGAEDGIFTTNSPIDDRHPRSPSEENHTAGWRVRRDASHLLWPQSLLLAPS